MIPHSGLGAQHELGWLRMPALGKIPQFKRAYRVVMVFISQRTSTPTQCNSSGVATGDLVR